MADDQEPLQNDPNFVANQTGQDTNAPSGAPMGLPEPTQPQGQPDVGDFGVPVEMTRKAREEAPARPTPTAQVDDYGNPIPGSTEQQPLDLKGYMQRNTAMPEDRYTAESKKADPKGEMTVQQRHLQTIANQQDPTDQMGAVLTGAKRYDAGRSLAAVAAANDHYYQATEFFRHASDYVPKLHDMDVTQTRDGVVITQGDQVYNLRNDQFKDFLHSNDSHFDMLQRNGLADAMARVTRDRSPVGAQGPGSENPAEARSTTDIGVGPTKEQFVGETPAAARDADVPVPERANLPGEKGGRLQEDVGPTKEQMAPGYHPTPAPEAARPAGPATPSAQHDFPQTAAERAANPEVVPYWQTGIDADINIVGRQGGRRSASHTEPAPALNSNVRDIPLEVYQQGTRAFRESLSPAERALVREKYYTAAERGSADIAPQAAPQDRAAAYDRAAADRSQPAPAQAPARAPAQVQAGAQQFRNQLPGYTPPQLGPNQQYKPSTGPIRDPDNPARVYQNPSPAMRRLADTGSLNMPGQEDRRLSPDEAAEAKEFTERHPQSGGYAITPQSGGQPVTSVITDEQLKTMEKRSSSQKPGKYGTATSSSSESHREAKPITQPLYNPQQERGGSKDPALQDAIAQHQAQGKIYATLRKQAEGGELTPEQQYQVNVYEARAGGYEPAPVRVKTPADAQRLPHGTRIILPDGSPGQVP